MFQARKFVEVRKSSKKDNTLKWCCPVCSKLVDDKYVFKKHVFNHFDNDLEYYCENCCYLFKTANDLDQHYLICKNESSKFYNY